MHAFPDWVIFIVANIEYIAVSVCTVGLVVAVVEILRTRNDNS